MTCKNCYYCKKCSGSTRCEYYDPVFTDEKYIQDEYEAALKERVDDYQEIIDEMED